MKIQSGFPPNIEKIRKTFRLSGREVFTYGDIVFLGAGGQIDGALAAHEQTHIEQQTEMGAEPWWDRYLEDKEFRLSQELPAYQKQYREAKKVIKDRERLNKFLILIARDMSGPMYGNMIGFNEATRLIKQ